MNHNCTEADQLYDAIVNDDLPKVKKILLETYININSLCSNGMTPLCAAVHKGNLTICETLLKHYKNSLEKDKDLPHNPKNRCINLTDSQNNQANTLKNVGYFVVKKEDCVSQEEDNDDDSNSDVSTPEGMEALEWDSEIKPAPELPLTNSLYQWYADILTKTSDLLCAPVVNDINQMDRFGRTALLYAAERGHIPIVQLLLDVGCNVNQTSADNISALHFAAQEGHTEIVKVLLQQGARIHHSTNRKITALHVASAMGHTDIIQHLLDCGADINATDSNSCTPLRIAAARQQLQAVEVLIKNGTKINIEDNHGFTPLCEAVWANSVPLVQILISAGAKIIPSHYLLHYSVKHNRLDIVRLLVSAGSVVNLRNEEGDTPLIVAAKTGNVDAARLLIEHGASANLPNKLSDATPLFEAVQHIDDPEKYKPMIRLLITHGVGSELHIICDTAFLHAIFLYKTDMACYFIQLGLDVNYWDSRMHVDYMTIARTLDNFKLVKMLVFSGFGLSKIVDIKPGKNNFYCEVDKISQWLKHKMYNPMSLMALCRIRIRKCLGRHVYSILENGDLPVPQQVNRYLNLDDISI